MLVFFFFWFFFFSSRRLHTRLSGDWSSDVCSSDLKSLLFLCKREVLSRRECFRTLIYLEMTQLFSTLSSVSLAQDRNSGNQNTWRNDCMFSSVQWLSRV